MEITRRFKLRGPTPGRVRVIFTDDMVKTALRHGFDEKDAKMLHAFCVLDYYKWPLIVVSFTATLQDIVHECGHVAFSLLEYAGVPVSYKKNEAYCYVLDYIFGQVVKLQKTLND